MYKEPMALWKVLLIAIPTMCILSWLSLYILTQKILPEAKHQIIDIIQQSQKPAVEK